MEKLTIPVEEECAFSGRNLVAHNNSFGCLKGGLNDDIPSLICPSTTQHPIYSDKDRGIGRSFHAVTRLARKSSSHPAALRLLLKDVFPDALRSRGHHTIYTEWYA